MNIHEESEREGRKNVAISFEIPASRSIAGKFVFNCNNPEAMNKKKEKNIAKAYEECNEISEHSIKYFPQMLQRNQNFNSIKFFRVCKNKAHAGGEKFSKNSSLFLNG